MAIIGEGRVPLVVYGPDGTRTIIGSAVVEELGSLMRITAEVNQSEFSDHVKPKVLDKMLYGLSIDYTGLDLYSEKNPE